MKIRETVDDSSMSNQRMPTSTKVLIADEHFLMAQGLRKLLESEFQYVEILENGRELFKAAASFKPDVILLDSVLAPWNGIELAVYFQKLSAASKVIVLAGHAEPGYVAEACRSLTSGRKRMRAEAVFVFGIDSGDPSSGQGKVLCDASDFGACNCGGCQ